MTLQHFLTHLQNVKGGPSQFTARCPSHDDTHNSLSIGEGQNGRILVTCHAGCSFEKVLSSLNLTTQDLFDDDTLKPKRARGEVTMQKCKISETIYPYTAADGALLFETVRIQYNDGSKSFRQRVKTEKGYVYKLGAVEPVLYKLPTIRQIIDDEGNGSLIALCEGEKDADALCALGLCATTCPMGAGKWRESYTQSLKGAGQVVIFPDNDEPGRAHALKVASALKDEGIPVKIVDLMALHPTLAHKGDISDVLAAVVPMTVEKLLSPAVSVQQFEAMAAKKSEPYIFETVADYLRDGFEAELLRNQAQQKLTTGFSSLDAQLDGHLYPGLYVIGSVSSLGKTAFCLQLADHIGATGRDVLFFTLEMSRAEMVARTLTRMLFTGSSRQEVGVGEVLGGQVDGLLMAEAMERYMLSSASHLSFVEGTASGITAAQIAQRARRHVEKSGRVPVVFVDYLQILTPADLRMTDKQAMDEAVITLKRLSRELDAPVVAVSSFNRQSYADEVNMAAFKESGAIEYSADFVMGLQARGVSQQEVTRLDEKRLARIIGDATKKAKQQNPRPIEAVTLKNRRGPAWACFGLDFYPKQNLFIETGRLRGGL